MMRSQKAQEERGLCLSKTSKSKKAAREYTSSIESSSADLAQFAFSLGRGESDWMNAYNEEGVREEEAMALRTLTFSFEDKKHSESPQVFTNYH